MADSLKEADERETREKYRRAADKAWKTIRRKKIYKVAPYTQTIEEFVPPEEVGFIEHPESVPFAPEVEPSEKSYGRNLVTQFHKTPSDIVCGRFWELRWAFGCPLDCSYCYLQGTMKGKMKPRYVRMDHVLGALDEAFADPEFNGGRPALFNSGELSDSLMNPPLMEKIADKFEEQEKHKLFTLSKFGPRNARFLYKKQRRNTICGWSINPPEVAKRWEKASAPPMERIHAARFVSEAGYEVRVRIDPMFPIEGWKEHYRKLVLDILSNVKPSRIILGTPRGLWKTIKYSEELGRDMDWVKFFAPDDTGWGKKLPLATRQAMYEFMFGILTAYGYPKNRVSMCKETRSLWDVMGLPYVPLTCQCYGR